MALPNDSIDVTPGTGATVATHTVSSKEYQVVMMANPTGNLVGTIPTYSAWSTAIASTANLVYLHVFNASGSGKIVKMRKVFIQPSQAIVAAPAAHTWRIAKTSAVGTTGNTAITIRQHDSADAAVPAQITAARSYTAGGTQTFTYFEVSIATEETAAGNGLAGLVNILPNDGDVVSDYILREGEGLAVQVVTAAAAYTWSVLGVFSIE
jgi:hypothetical protein